MELTRRRAIAALGSTMLVPVVAGAAYGAKQSAADKTFAKLAARWLDRSMKFSPVSATQVGDHRFDAMLDDVSAGGRNTGLAFAKQTLTALEAIDRKQLSRANQVDAALLANALKSQIWTTESVQDWAWNPLGYQGIAGGAIYTLMAREFAPIEKRLAAATRRMELIPAFLKQTRGELVPSRVPVPHAATYSAQHKGLKSIIGEMVDPHKDKLSGPARTRLDAAIATYNAACDEHQAWIDGTLVPAAQADYRAGVERFDTQLAFTLQSTLSRSDIRTRAEAAMTKCRSEMYAVARKALAGRADAPETPDNPSPEQQQKAIKAALELSASERPPRDKLVEVATDAVEHARKFVQERDLITLPAGPVKVILMPEFQRGFSVAYCDSPGPLDKNLDTFYAVSPIPTEWTDEQTTSFLREYNTRGIIDLGVHEAMPGHYVQIFHSNSYPSVLRAILSSGSFVEGWAVYAQEMMVAEGFEAGDPLYKLQQLKMLLRSISNAIIDQAIHVDGMTQAEMMKFLTEGAFQEEREAAGKWRRAQLSVTQLSTYFVGYAEHVETRAAAEKRAGFKLKAYHDKVLSYGSPPMRYARALMFGEGIG
ncbi:MAG: DUF885 domain-containing protein [Alphaproteobacteria bacterium]|nr:DUF885 domain-containing protein [Alphaproteobacteria bacterium]